MCRIRRTTRSAKVDEEAWTRSTPTRPANGPHRNEIINHFGDEALKVFGVLGAYRMAKKPTGRNLFAIDYAKIDSILSDANAPLLKRRNDLMQAYDSLPRSLGSIDEIDRAQAFAKDAYALLSEAKSARLDDGRPFSEATKAVKGFFDRVERPIKAILAELSARVTEAVIRQQRLLASHQPDEPDEVEDEAAEVIEAAIVDIRTGKPVVAVVEVSATEMPKLEWTIEGFERSRIDLESLRPFLTDSSILLACRKHMDLHGPNKLLGVSYGQVAVTR